MNVTVSTVERDKNVSCHLRRLHAMGLDENYGRPSIGSPVRRRSGMPSGFQRFRRQSIAGCDVLVDGLARELVIPSCGLALNGFAGNACNRQRTSLAHSLNVARPLANLLGCFWV